MRMIAFEVYINQQRTAVVGLKGLGVLSAILHSVARVAGVPEIGLDLGGLENMDGGLRRNFRWDSLVLKPGDEITVRIRASGDFDDPSDSTLEEPDETLHKKLDYYRELKAELEGKGLV